jgi:tetraacyldisaccharide 4'-kinase
VRVPVIVVGNVTVGGGGKTPTVMEIANHLGACGLRVGVVSRGYGRHTSVCVEVQPEDAADTCGDEPLLLRRTLGIPVFVHANRAHAAQALLARHPATQVIVCDDGLQHYGLYRDVEVCVIDAEGFGNKRLLPAGPMRQHWPPALVCEAGQDATRTLLLHTAGAAWPGRFSAHRRLASQLMDASGKTRSMVALAEGRQPVVAIAAIAKPEAFFAMLRLQGLTLAHTLALPDHDDFSQFARHAAAFPSGAVLICTQKDATKLWPQCPQALAAVLEQRSEPAFFQALDALLQARPAA